MNNSQFSADPLAQRDYFQEVVDRANETRYNWFPLVEFLTFNNRPEDIARCVLECYSMLSHYIMKDQQAAGCDATVNNVDHLKILYDALSAMREETDTAMEVNCPENVKKFLDIIELKEKLIERQNTKIELQKKEINVLERRICELLRLIIEEQKQTDLKN